MQEHAFNLVDWYPWSDESLKKAKNDNKPIFLSIGYSTCHWCHRMREESFEDQKTASFINKNFIPIKVDREERPELDAYYMNAVQAMTGSGGWPLSVFLTPDLKPFYGGTYYPPQPRYGMPSFMQILEFVAQVWKDRREEIVKNSEEVAKAIGGGLSHRAKDELEPKLVEEGFNSIVASFDSVHGGFGGSPKFPVPLTSEFLLSYYHRSGKELALRSVTKTLDEIMSGGIRDHVGGGFHRYATDRIWLVPHFEKMLYDNALLAALYSRAYQATRKPAYAEVVRETLAWLLKEMRAKEGGFYSAQDADTSEGEGTYYTWTPSEVEGVLGKKAATAFDGTYGITQNGNFEGRSILHVDPSRNQDGQGFLAPKSALYAERIKRPRPKTDDKVLTSWNGLAISAMAVASMVLNAPEYARAGEEAAGFILEKNSKEGRLLRRFAGGEAAFEGTLEDYAFFVQGLTDLFEATGNPRWLREAIRLTDLMLEDFEDKESGGFYLTVRPEPIRLKESYDGPTPSGNSLATVDLLRLAEITGNEKYKEAAGRALKFFSSDLEQQPSAHANMLIALDLYVNGMKEIVISSTSEATAKEMLAVVNETFLPDKVLVQLTTKNFEALSELSGLVEGRRPGKKTRAFVCQNFVCKLPADTPEALRSQLISGN